MTQNSLATAKNHEQLLWGHYKETISLARRYFFKKLSSHFSTGFCCTSASKRYRPGTKCRACLWDTKASHKLTESKWLEHVSHWPALTLSMERLKESGSLLWIMPDTRLNPCVLWVPSFVNHKFQSVHHGIPTILGVSTVAWNHF